MTPSLSMRFEVVVMGCHNLCKDMCTEVAVICLFEKKMLHEAKHFHLIIKCKSVYI